MLIVSERERERDKSHERCGDSVENERTKVTGARVCFSESVCVTCADGE